MTHRHKGLTMEVEKHKNNDVSTMRMSQEENNITINVTLQTINPKRQNVMEGNCTILLPVYHI